MAGGRSAARVRDEIAGLLAHHWLGAADEDKAVALPHVGGRPRPSGVRARRGDRPLPGAAAAPGAARRANRRSRSVLFKLALALHMSLRFAEADATYQRAFEHWDRRRRRSRPTARPCGSPAASCPTTPTRARRSPGRTSSCACSCSTGWSSSGRSARSCRRSRSAGRSPTTASATCSISGRACAGPTARRSRPTTSSSASSGCSNPDAPGSSVAIYFVLENGQDYYLRRTPTRTRIGVRALDDRTVEFRLVAPAPYFMSVMNRPDGGPAAPPCDRAATATTGPSPDPGRVSGAFRIDERGPTTRSCCSAATTTRVREAATSSACRVRAAPIADGVEPFARDELDLVIGAVHAAARRPRCPADVPRRAARARRVVGLPRVRSPAIRDRRTSTCGGPWRHAVDRERARGGPARQHGGGDRRHRAARAPGPHARHRAAVRPGPARGAPRACRGSAER